MWLEYLRIAWSLLRAFKFRSALTIGSITIGAFSIVLMSSLADGGLRTLSAGWEEIGGARVMALWGRPPEDQRAHRMSYTRGLTIEDIDVVRQLPHLATATLVADQSDKELISDSGQRFNVDIVGVDREFFPFFNYQLDKGRFLDAEDGRGHGRVCVVGHKTAERLAEDGRPALGRQVLIAGVRCQIVGQLQTLDRWGMGFGWEWDDFVSMPITTLTDAQGRVAEQGRWVLLRSDDPVHNEAVKGLINAVLRERHHGLNDFTILDFYKTFIEDFLKVLRIMQTVVSLLAGIALLVGGVGIMNIMLVSVAERVREIGIRKALGASPADISRQFLVEATLLSGVGGLLGVLAGFSGAVLGGLVIRHFKPRWILALSEPAALAALAVALIVGLVFGYYPARTASRLDAVAAIRGGA